MNLDVIPGYKTYVVAAAAALLVAARIIGYIDEPTFNALLTCLGIGGAITIKIGQNRIERKIDESGAPARTQNIPPPDSAGIT